MKKWLFPLTCLFLVVFAATVSGQAISVKSVKKISGSTGNFTDILADNDAFGSGVTEAGDLDRDGTTDIIVGVEGYDDGATDNGALLTLFLNPDGTVKRQVLLSRSTSFSRPAQDNEKCGKSLAKIGDLDDDGYPEIAIACPGSDRESTTNYFRIGFLNPDGTLKKHVLVTKPTESPDDFPAYHYFGYSISPIGDLDNDGIEDIAASDPWNSRRVGATAALYEGAIFILFLNKDGTVKSNKKISIGRRTHLGLSVIPLNDFDNDSIEDLLAVSSTSIFDLFLSSGGTPRLQFLYLNQDGTLKNSSETTTSSPRLVDSFGIHSGALLGDIDNDSINDVLVGAWRYNTSGSSPLDPNNPGAIQISTLKSDGTVKNSILITNGENGFPTSLDKYDKFGHSVSPLGDFDGDRVMDYVVGAPGDDDGIGADKGAVYIILMNGPPTLQCTEGCTASGTKQCSASVPQECRIDGDYDACKEWVNLAACTTGTTCTGNGVCTAPTGCSDECTVRGQGRCTAGIPQTCATDGDPDICLEWKSLAACTTGTTCANGQCLAGNTRLICENNACVQAAGTGGNECSANSDCSAKHLECVSNSCQLVQGSGANKCQTDSQCATDPLPTHIICDNNACMQVYGTGSNVCSKNADCTSRHMECIGNTCSLVNGAGTNKCQTDSQCSGGSPYPTHLVCENQACVQAYGTGSNLCSINADCTNMHLDCLNKSCQRVLGSGANKCQTDSQCQGTPIQTHLVCLNNSCVPTSGAGSNECSTNNDCAGKHLECVGNSCQLVPGTGDNKCQTDGQCIPCTDECTTRGTGQCTATGNPQICDVDGDTDTCLEWKQLPACPPSQVCFEGFCTTLLYSKEVMITQGKANFYGPLNNYDDFGRTVAEIGDLDNDGIRDVAVGAPWDDSPNNTGAVWILFLNNDGTVKSHKKIANGLNGFPDGQINMFDNFGTSIAKIGDLDGDNVQDIAVGAPGSISTSTGAVWIIFLKTDGTVKGVQKISSNVGGFNANLWPESNFGNSIAFMGNLDGQGASVAAIAVGNPLDGEDSPVACLCSQSPCPPPKRCAIGTVWILFLKDDGTVLRYEKLTNNSGGVGELPLYGLFGFSVTGMGDFDNDGVQEIVAGAPAGRAYQNPISAVYFLFLNSDGRVKKYAKIPETSDFNNWFGYSIAGLWDLDNDGIRDLAVGSPKYTNYSFLDASKALGAIDIIYLNSDGSMKLHAFKLTDAHERFGGTLLLDKTGEFGTSVANIGDLDGDGIQDISVGDIRESIQNFGADWEFFLLGATTLACSDDCITLNEKKCTGNTPQQCRIDGDYDACKEWVNLAACTTGTTCTGNGVCTGGGNTRLICENNACVSVSGSGNSLCSTNANCTNKHLECVSNSCQLVPGTGNNKCQTDIQCTGTETHLACENEACVAVAGSGSNLCSINSDCTAKHLECVSNTCSLVPGTGNNKCQTDGQCIPCTDECTTRGTGRCVDATTPQICDVDGDADTCLEWKTLPACRQGETCSNGQCIASNTRLICENNACVQVSGSGSNLCSINSDCTAKHLECVGNTCSLVPGTGNNQCQTDSQCQVGETHSICENNSCVTVSGPGSSSCSVDADCTAKHMECVNQTCALVSGLGANKCQSDDQCFSGTSFEVQLAKQNLPKGEQQTVDIIIKTTVGFSAVVTMQLEKAITGDALGDASGETTLSPNPIDTKTVSFNGPPPYPNFDTRGLAEGSYKVSVVVNDKGSGEELFQDVFYFSVVEKPTALTVAETDPFLAIAVALIVLFVLKSKKQ